jgi:hypothetical protein
MAQWADHPFGTQVLVPQGPGFDPRNARPQFSVTFSTVKVNVSLTPNSSTISTHIWKLPRPILESCGTFRNKNPAGLDLWWPDSGMMQMIQTQESTLLARFWNNRQETGSRFLKFT